MLARDFDRTARAERDLAKLRRRGDKRRVRSSLKHLPEGKRQELRLVTQILQAQFAEAVASRTAEHLVNGRIVKIILFGSYARGDWVEDPVGRYFSDYDLLVVVDHERLTDGLEFWEGAEQQLLSELSAGVRLRTPVNFIVHTLEDVNHQLERGRYFFIDIVRDGIVLFDTPELPFVDPQPLTPSHALEEAEQHFEEGFSGAVDFISGVNFYREQGKGKPAAFLLHQAVERLYQCILLVLTLYSPKSHNLVRLAKLSEALDARLAVVWPSETKFERRCFELLRAAYVKGRYSRHYKISDEELDWLQERVEILMGLVREICQERLQALRDESSRD